MASFGVTAWGLDLGVIECKVLPVQILVQLLKKCCIGIDERHLQHDIRYPARSEPVAKNVQQQVGVAPGIVDRAH